LRCSIAALKSSRRRRRGVRLRVASRAAEDRDKAAGGPNSANR
jgi:hypothetical protein